ncbi:MAG: HlyD family efflux transporter periplasmic adaptor subunit [bacterium]|nr:HlyD family efflux transporter periplasmic adaptor subunit [bacterium]
MNLLEKIKNLILVKEDDSYEFKPILAEIEDSPVNPIGNTVFWIVITFMVIASLWMYFGKVDIVVTARGLVIPSGEEKLVQSLDKGVLTTLAVKEGDYVTAGQIVAIVSPAEYEPGLELNNLKEEEARTSEELAAARGKYKIALENKNRLSSVRDIIPASRYDETAKEVTELQHAIGAYSATLSEIRNKRLQIEKQKQILKSPIDGYVNKILIHTEGGVVTPAEKIMSIVPKNAKMQIKAKVLNQDVGFIETNMPVSIKIDTYNFQKYGILEGVVTVVSPNSIKDEQLGDIYEVYIEPQNTKLMVEGKEQTIKYGMTTTNEIKIGKRRIIEFFIYPLIKYLDESIKVR